MKVNFILVYLNLREIAGYELRVTTLLVCNLMTSLVII